MTKSLQELIQDLAWCKQNLPPQSKVDAKEDWKYEYLNKTQDVKIQIINSTSKELVKAIKGSDKPITVEQFYEIFEGTGQMVHDLIGHQYSLIVIDGYSELMLSVADYVDTSSLSEQDKIAFETDMYYVLTQLAVIPDPVVMHRYGNTDSVRPFLMTTRKTISDMIQVCNSSGNSQMVVKPYILKALTALTANDLPINIDRTLFIIILSHLSHMKNYCKEVNAEELLHLRSEVEGLISSLSEPPTQDLGGAKFSSKLFVDGLSISWIEEVYRPEVMETIPHDKAEELVTASKSKSTLRAISGDFRDLD